MQRLGYNMLYIKGQGVPSTGKVACETLLEQKSAALAHTAFKATAPALNDALLTART